MTCRFCKYVTYDFSSELEKFVDLNEAITYCFHFHSILIATAYNRRPRLVHGLFQSLKWLTHVVLETVRWNNRK